VVVSERRFEAIAPCVVLDNKDGARQATQYLVRTGHKRVAILTGPEDGATLPTAWRGFKEVLRESSFLSTQASSSPGTSASTPARGYGTVALPRTRRRRCSPPTT
jgi:DNA-binding LacI/PurR family transcriptional regulator